MSVRLRDRPRLIPSAVTTTVFVVAAIAVFEGVFVAILWSGIVQAVLTPVINAPLVWAASALIAALYIIWSVRGLPDLRPLLLRLEPIWLLGIALAVSSSLLEEFAFRTMIMNGIRSSGGGLVEQILISAVAFGLLHAVWGARGGLRATMTAVFHTTALGVALAILFIVGGRALLPCVVAHFLINAVLEPWLIYVYIARTRTPQVAT